ncbi:tRNA epoxyqueuosine(34) reductase QueG [Fodinisporobacter ferrooxydans]|uniref:tRNA epoxyqueuosine(34) reductase QueG n=1 Tax=Fodinisporobacter ferrooxydans TaxID=2901836 RepID=A0ABY4CKJ9_9BACL|nr:tRNA epoxyqueuosine(34) reductase QueG [Alicyclobacillaceae bacterium MYW30-H2]
MSQLLTRGILEDIAERIGIDAIGVTDARPFLELKPILEAYREHGYETGFEHPVIEERMDPSLLVPDAKSIIAIAIAYKTAQTDRTRKPAEGIRGMVSKYAWGKDYHHVLREKLVQLVAELEVYAGHPFQYHMSVDTGPMVDRAVANRAGIGWVGKNCSIITEAHGSWVFLGQLVTDLPFAEWSQPILSQCGDCDLCITACPTGALTPFSTNSSKCLSYITQMKGHIPEEYRKKLGKRIWGCDTCQVVCPENKHPNLLLSLHEQFLPEPELAYPDLMAILEMSNRQFKRIFGHTALAWRGLKVMQRNAILALGNLHDQRAIPKLKALVEDPREEIRAAAAWSLGQIGSSDQIPFLHTALEQETDEVVKHEILQAIQQLESV